MKKLFKSVLVAVVLISSGVFAQKKKSSFSCSMKNLLWEISGIVEIFLFIWNDSYVNDYFFI
jgi:hypothetical protein